MSEFAQKYLDIELPAHQLRWIQSWDRNSMNLTLGPREHGKSTADMVYSTYSICNDATLRILIASHKEEQANILSRSIQMNLERPDIQKDFPNVIPGKPWRVGVAFFEGKKHPVLKTVAKQAGMTGGRFDWVIFDDLLTTENTATEKMRQRIERWIGSEVFPSIDHTPKRKIIVVGTRKHIDDWYGKLLKSQQFTTTVDQLYTKNAAGEKVYLWPERFDQKAEDEARAFMSPDLFAQEYMNSPVALEGLHFKREWLRFYTELPDKRFLKFYMGVDPSMGSQKDKSSYLGVAVIATDERDEERIYVVHLSRWKLSLAEQMDKILEIQNEYHATGFIEGVLVNKSFAQSVVDRIPDFTLIDYMHTGLKGTSDVSKTGRIQNIIGFLFKESRIYMRSPQVDPSVKEFIEREYVQFSPDNPKTDMDLLDALNMACDQVDYRIRCDELPVYTF